VIIYIQQYNLSIKIDMTEKMYSQSRINCPCRIKVENKKPNSDVGFDEIVKFLNAQKAVMDYAGLN
jgi:hypothetical protein